MILNTDEVVTQEMLGRLVGVGQPRISQLTTAGLIPAEGTLGEQLLAYCAYQREIAAGRATNGPLDLAQERAALARAQREGVDLRNAVLRAEYAEVRILEQLLAAASQAVVERLEHLPGQLRTACPELPQLALDQLMAVIAAARNEWARHTARLVLEQVVDVDDEDAAVELEVDQQIVHTVHDFAAEDSDAAAAA